MFYRICETTVNWQWRSQWDRTRPSESGSSSNPETRTQTVSNCKKMSNEWKSSPVKPFKGSKLSARTEGTPPLTRPVGFLQLVTVKSSTPHPDPPEGHETENITQAAFLCLNPTRPKSAVTEPVEYTVYLYRPTQFVQVHQRRFGFMWSVV